jgi:polyphosphate kinase
MPRNLDRRVELLFPILDPTLVRVIKDVIIDRYLADTRKTRIAKSDGTYESGGGFMDAQAWFVSHHTRLTGA